MKKTLAAVLAAAMALSTATVAMAVDHDVASEFGWNSDSTGSNGADVEFGKDVVLNITKLGDLGQTELAALYDEGYISITPIVTDGSSNLSGKPAVSYVRIKDKSNGTGIFKEEYKYTWNGSDYSTTVDGKTVNLKQNRTILKDSTLVPMETTYNTLNTDAPDKFVTWKYYRTNYQTEADAAIAAGVISKELVNLKEDTTSTEGSNAVQVKFKIAHTYGTSSKSASMKFRMTVRKSFDSEDGTSYAKGDTYTTDKYTFTAEYHQLSDYYTDMQLTTQEVSNNNVILNGSNLYDRIGDSKFTITFGDDIAMFEGKSAVNQKNVNLYYSLDEIDTIKDAYPDVDFTFLTFKGNGAPVFQNTGKMVFAAKDKNTTVYSWDGEVLTPISDPKNYDDTYKTVTVSGIKKLGTYVIADQILEVEEEPEEPAEPVDSTPVAEPDDDEGQNPNTGAC